MKLSLFAGRQPRLVHHYRGHKMSIWLSLIPQLQKTGQNSIYPSHNSLLLDGPSWGVVRNSTTSNMMANIDNKAAAKNGLGGLAPPSTTCMTLSESAQVCLHNRWSASIFHPSSKMEEGTSGRNILFQSSFSQQLF